MGNITQVTVNDASFPFGYDQTQFDLCLDVPVLKDNLNSICEKVDDDDFQTIILRKLNEVNFMYKMWACCYYWLLGMKSAVFLFLRVMCDWDIYSAWTVAPLGMDFFKANMVQLSLHYSDVLYTERNALGIQHYHKYTI